MQLKKTISMFIGLLVFCVATYIVLSSIINGIGSTFVFSAHSLAPMRSPVVVVIVDKTHYTPGEEISVTVTNGLPIAIQAYKYKSQCSMFLLEWQDQQGNWVVMNRCRRWSMANPITILPQSSLVQGLKSPTIGWTRVGGLGETPHGNYRIILGFGTPDSPVTKSSTVYSPTFVID